MHSFLDRHFFRVTDKYIDIPICAQSAVKMVVGWLDNRV